MNFEKLRGVSQAKAHSQEITHLLKKAGESMRTTNTQQLKRELEVAELEAREKARADFIKLNPVIEYESQAKEKKALDKSYIKLIKNI